MPLEVLIIDDDPIFQLIVSKNLKNLGEFDIINYLDPQEGLNYILNQDHLPDILFLDLNMPNLNGWELLDALNASQIDLHKTKIFIVTSSIDRQDREKSYAYDIVDFLNKPLKTPTLKKIFIKSPPFSQSE